MSVKKQKKPEINQDPTYGLSDLETELRNKINLLGDEANQGEVLGRKDYLALWFVGVGIPIILLVWAWNS